MKCPVCDGFGYVIITEVDGHQVYPHSFIPYSEPATSYWQPTTRMWKSLCDGCDGTGKLKEENKNESNNFSLHL